MGMSLEELCAVKIAIPVPKLDGHIVTTSEEVWQGGVDLNISDVIGMSLKLLSLQHQTKCCVRECEREKKQNNEM